MSRGHWKAVVGVLGGWLLAQALLSLVVLGTLQATSDWVLDRASGSLEVVLLTTAIVLAVDVVVAAGLTILGSVGLAALVLGLYRAVGGPESSPQVQEGGRDVAGWRPLRWALVGTGVGLLVLVGTIEYASYLIISDMDLEDRVEITAHRAGSKLGPENTIGALERSIEAGADWAEIDVQLTSDGVLAVIHDTDTLRVSGVRHVVDRTPFETIQALDVGSPFSADFAGERIPSLDQVLAAADNQIGMTIELKLKSAGEVEAMVDAVVEDLRKASGKARRHRICSQSLDAMKRAKGLEPELAVGFIAGAAIGDLTRLDVDFLMVSASMATRNLLAAAKATEPAGACLDGQRCRPDDSPDRSRCHQHHHQQPGANDQAAQRTTRAWDRGAAAGSGASPDQRLREKDGNNGTSVSSTEEVDPFEFDAVTLGGEQGRG